MEVGGVPDSFTYLMDPFHPTELPQPVQTENFLSGLMVSCCTMFH